MKRNHTMLEPRRIPSQDRAKARVDLILAATSELLCEFGVSAVTTARVAERAGVPVGSVYQYFPNKKAIFVAIFEGYLRGVRDALEALRVAFRAFPELREYETGHVERVVEAMVRIFKRLGSGWSKPKLRRLMHYGYALNEGSLWYRFEREPPARESLEWDREIALAVYGLCMDE